MLQISLRLGQLCSYHLLGCFPWSLIFICKCLLASHRAPNGKEKTQPSPGFLLSRTLAKGMPTWGHSSEKTSKQIFSRYLKTKGVQTHRSKSLLKSESFLGLQVEQSTWCPLSHFQLQICTQPGGHSEGANGMKVVFCVGQVVIQQFI